MVSKPYTYSSKTKTITLPCKQEFPLSGPQIGTYSSDGALEVAGYQPSWDGSCDRADACTECPIYRNLYTRWG